MTDDLIELVRQRKVIYDSSCKEYKDHLIKNAAWEQIAEILKEPVNKCKDDWAKLRNAFSSALKRRRYKKSGQAAAALVPWKHEESMGFLLPYMECRTTKTNLMSTAESPPTEDSLDESLPASPSQSQSSSSRGKINHEPKLQELYDLMKSSQDLRRQKQNGRQEMDETDLFFLSMSKEVKALSKLEQTKIKLDLHTAISQAVIRQLEHRDKILRTPIKITTQRFIQSTPQHQSSTYIQTTADVQSPTYNHSTKHAQSPTYIESSSFPTTPRSQKYAVSNSDDSQRFTQSTPQHHSSTYIQTTADVQSPTYNYSTKHAQSPTYIESSLFPTTSLSQKYAVSNSDDSQRFTQSTPQHQSSTYIQTTADVQSPTYNHSAKHAQSPTYIELSSFPTTSRSQIRSSTNIHPVVQAPTYIQSPIHAQSPTYIQSSSFPSRLNSQPVVSDDLKAYYDSINFDDDKLENNG